MVRKAAGGLWIRMGIMRRALCIAWKSHGCMGGCCVNDRIADRVLREAEFILDTGATVRACAKMSGVGKTTVHKDMRERLKKLNPEKARQVSRVLDGNREERHIRGGQATKEKYLHL